MAEVALVRPPIEQNIISHETTFQKQQKDYLAKHEDEVKPNGKSPYTFALVSRAYRELSNGNLTEKLKSLVVQQIPRDELKLYIAVNNPRLWAIASEVSSVHEQELADLNPLEKAQALQTLIDEKYNDPSIVKSDWERNILDKGITWEEMQEKIKDYRENQATLRILEELTQTVNTLTTSDDDKNSEDLEIQAAAERIEIHAKNYLQDAQLHVLLRTVKLIMKKRMDVMGVDCSSATKSSDKQFSHGHATNKALHIAVSQGAKFLDVSDMDEYHAPKALNELYDLIQQKKIDVFIRPLSLVTPQYPDKIAKSDNLWATLIGYYSHSLTHDTMTFQNPYDFGTTGTMVVSVDAFRNHTYPEVELNEDFIWTNAMMDDHNLEKHHAVASSLLRSNRGRDISWDGRRLGGSAILQPSEQREHLNESQRYTVRDLIRDQNFLSTSFTFLHKFFPKLPNFLEVYNDYKKHFFEENQNNRKKARRIFLGIKDTEDGGVFFDPGGTLARLYSVCGDEKATDQVIHDAQLKPSTAAFFEQNPLLITGVAEEIKRLRQTTGKDLTLEEVAKYIETTLPELFAKPLSEEPSYRKIHTIVRPHSGVNMADYMHISQARAYFTNYLRNLQADGTLASYPVMARSVLSNML